MCEEVVGLTVHLSRPSVDHPPPRIRAAYCMCSGALEGGQGHVVSSLRKLSSGHAPARNSTFGNPRRDLLVPHAISPRHRTRSAYQTGGIDGEASLCHS